MKSFDESSNKVYNLLLKSLDYSFVAWKYELVFSPVYFELFPMIV